MKYKNTIIPVGLAVLLTAAAAGYNRCQQKNQEEPTTTKGNYFTKEEIDSIYGTSYKVNTTVTLEQKVDDDYEKSWFGSGTLLADSQTGDNYLFTAEHVTSGQIFTSKQTGQTAKVLKEKIVVEVYDATVFKENEKHDLAFLKLEGSPGKPFTGKIAERIGPGDYVIGVGFPDGNKELFSTRVTKITDKSTFLNISIVGGNSGGGVYLINGKELQFCGLVTKADHIPSLERVRDFFKGTPLEDDYLQ